MKRVLRRAPGRDPGGWRAKGAASLTKDVVMRRAGWPGMSAVGGKLPVCFRFECSKKQTLFD